MKIAFDAKRIVRNRTGLGSYGRTLVNEIARLDTDDELLLFAPDEGLDDLRLQVEQPSHVRFVYPNSPSVLKGVRKAVWRSRGIVKDLLREGVTVYHGLSGELPHGLKAAGIHGVVTIHDLIFLRHPEYYHRWDVEIYKRKFYQTLKEAERIIAISECTKRDILYFGDFPEKNIDLIYQSCGARFSLGVSEEKMQDVHAEYELPVRFVLSVGTVEERKNVLLAVRALRDLPDDIHIVIVGRQTEYVEKILSYVNANGLQARVHLLQGVPNDDLPALYQMAEAFVYPSRYEGFGIPIIEAVQSGLPVVACSGSCLEEAGGPHCLYVAPDDAEGMATAIGKVLKGAPGREERIAHSREYVRRFESSDVASQVLKVYKSMCVE